MFRLSLGYLYSFLSRNCDNVRVFKRQKDANEMLAKSYSGAMNGVDVRKLRHPAAIPCAAPHGQFHRLAGWRAHPVPGEGSLAHRGVFFP